MIIFTTFGILEVTVRPADEIEYQDDAILRLESPDRETLTHFGDTYMNTEMGTITCVSDNPPVFRTHVEPKYLAQAFGDLLHSLDYEELVDNASPKVRDLYKQVGDRIYRHYTRAVDYLRGR